MCFSQVFTSGNTTAPCRLFTRLCHTFLVSILFRVGCYALTQSVMVLLQVRITDWVYRQLCHCTTPIHPIIAPLIEAFVNSVIVPASRSDCTNDPISEDELSTIFSDLCVPNDHVNGSKKVGFTTQLLLVYYVLLYEDTLLTNMSSIGEILSIFHMATGHHLEFLKS